MKLKLIKITTIGLVLVISSYSGFAQSKGDAKNGRALVNTNCAACHGVDGIGKVGLGPSIYNRDFVALASDEFIKTTIKKGRAGTSMIPFAHLKDEQVNDIVAYLRSVPVVNKVKITVDPTKKYSGSTGNGKKLYASYCSHCHGDKGQGYSAGGPGPAIGTKGFLDVASDDFILATLKQGRVGTAMKEFIGSRGLAHMTEQDAKDVIVFLRSLAK